MRHVVTLCPALFFACAHVALPTVETVPPAETYSSLTEGKQTELADFLRSLVKADDLVHDDRLDKVAGLIAEYSAANNDEPPYRYIEQLLWRFGVAGCFNQKMSAFVNGKTDRERRLNTWLVQNASQLRNLRETAFGISREGGGTSGTAMAIVVMTNEVTIEPLRRTYQPGEAIVLSGKLRHRKEKQVMAFAPGAVTPEELAVIDGHFQVTWKAPDRPGAYAVELVGSVPAGHAVEEGRSLLRLRIVVGASEGFDPTPASRDPRVFAANVAGRINALRMQVGLAPVQVDLADAELAMHAQKLLGEGGDPSLDESVLHITQPTEGGVEWLWERIERPSVHARFLKPDGAVLKVAAAKDGDGWALVAEMK